MLAGRPARAVRGGTNTRITREVASVRRHELEDASAVAQRYNVKGLSNLRIIRVGLFGEFKASSRAGLSILAALLYACVSVPPPPPPCVKLAGTAGHFSGISWCNIDQVSLMVRRPMSNSKAIHSCRAIWPLMAKRHHQRFKRLSSKLHPRPLSAIMALSSTISSAPPSPRRDRTKSISRRFFWSNPMTGVVLCADAYARFQK